MSVSPQREGRGLRSFRLSDVPLELRLAAKDKLLKTPGSKDGMLVASSSFTERLAIGMAAEKPSDRVYWVPRAAYERALGGRRR